MNSIDQALPDTHNDVVAASDDERRVLIVAWSDVNPGDYYLFDRDKRDLKYLVSVMSWIEPDEMSPMRPIRYQARDGEIVHGYLTRPRKAAADTPLPMVLAVHGGPYRVRDDWGFDPEIQFLASRGYAVLNVNFRGSGGYGRRFEEIGCVSVPMAALEKDGRRAPSEKFLSRALEASFVVRDLATEQGLHLGARHRTGQTRDSFVHLTLRLLSGRDDAQKAALSETVLAAIEPLLPEVVSVGVEIVDMHRASYRKRVLD